MYLSTAMCKTQRRFCCGLGLHFSQFVILLKKIDGILNADKYHQILIQHTIPYGLAIFFCFFTFYFHF